MFQTAAGHSKWPIYVPPSPLPPTFDYPLSLSLSHTTRSATFTCSRDLLQITECYPSRISRRGEARHAALPSRYQRTWILACWPRCCGCGWWIADDCGRLRMCGCHWLTVPLFLAVRPVALLMWRCN